MVAFISSSKGLSWYFAVSLGISSLTFSYWFEAISSIQNRVHKQRASLIAQLVKNPPAMRETWVLSLGRSPGEGKGYPLQYSGLENSMDCIVHGVTKSQTWLSDFHWNYYQNKKRWHVLQEYRETETFLYCRWDCKMVQSLWKQYGDSSKN